MRTKGRRFVSLLVALLMTVIFVMPVFAQTSGCKNVSNYGNWNVIDTPKPKSGPSQITDHAVDPTNADIIYATNGAVVAVSINGGCDWTQPYPGTPGDAVPSSIKAIDAPSMSVAVVAHQRAADVLGAPAIAYTEDAGETWSEGGVGLPPAGTIEFLESPGDVQEIIFAGIDEGAGAADLLYASRDNGATWTLQSDLTTLRPQMSIYGLTADPLDPNVLYAYGPGGLYKSENTGKSFEPIPELAGENVVDADVIHETNQKGRILALIGGKNQAQLSDNDGKSFNIVPTPSQGTSVDHGSADWQFLLTAGGTTFEYDRQTRGWFDLGAPVDGTVDVGGIRGLPTLSLSVHTDKVIEVYRSASGTGTTTGTPVSGTNVSLNQNPAMAAKDATFGPPGKKIYLKAGEEKTVPYVLTVPPRRVPLDVYFLVDTSSSMKNTIDSLATRLGDITNALLARKIDVQFGLAVYRSYPNSFPPRQECRPGDPPVPGAPCEHNYVYEQVVDISRDTGDLQAGLSNLVADAGGTYDAHLEALKATATGEPVDLPPVGIENRYDVGPGEQARFRDKSVRVVIHATDEAFGRVDSDSDNDPTGVSKGPPPDIPPEGPIIDAFNANDVEHVGLSVGRLPYRDMVEFSRATGTLASKDIDCDRNGVVDIPAGDPLVCKLFQEDLASEIPNIVPAVTNLLSGVQDRTDVTLLAKSGGDVIEEGEEVVRNITPTVYPDMVLQTAHELPFNVTYACTKALAGKHYPVKISPSSPDVPHLGDLSIETEVVCLKEKKKDEVPFVPPYLTIPLIGLVVPPPPPPPPAPVTQINPASQTQAQAQGQAQAAAATQEEEQPQLAYVTAYNDALENEFAMTAYQPRHRGIPPGAALGIGAVSVSMMYGAGLALRRRTRVERARY